jgi:hypothetical protein
VRSTLAGANAAVSVTALTSGVAVVVALDGLLKEAPLDGDTVHPLKE